MSLDPDQLHYDESLFEAHLRRQPVQPPGGDDPERARQHAELARVFAALQALEAEAPPADLKSRVLSRVRAAGASQPPPLRVTPADASAGDNPRVIQLHGLRDIVAVAAMIVLAIGIGVPGLLQMRDRENRIACAANLARVGVGMQMYGAEFDRQLPFVGWSQAASWAPTGDPGVRVVPNRAHLYPLVLTRLVDDPRVLVCPSATSDVPLARTQVHELGGFPESRNVSYAYQNMAGQRPRIDQSVAALPILGDDNPLFDNGIPLLDAAAHRLGLADPAGANSRAHDGAGQNVLTVDGSAKWFTRPTIGVQGDNIWTLSDVQEYTGREGPQAMTDAHLLK